jgi:hypothetical protein
MRRARCWIAASVEEQCARVVTSTEPPAPVPAVVLEISAPDSSVICGAVTVTDPALPLAVEVAETRIPLPGSLTLSGPCELTRTVPASPAPAVIVETLAPPDSAIAPPAVSTTSPAAPVAPASAEAVIPLAPPDPAPDNVTLFATVTATSPPLRGPAVVAAICAPPAMVSALAPTVTEPPGPDCGPVAEAAIWVLDTPAPSSVNAPGVVTSTEPPAPVPAVVLEISAPDSSAICGAVTITDPALPLAAEPAEAMIPLPASLKLSDPRAATCTVPPLPRPAVPELTRPPPVTTMS